MPCLQKSLPSELLSCGVTSSSSEVEVALASGGMSALHSSKAFLSLFMGSFGSGLNLTSSLPPCSCAMAMALVTSCLLWTGVPLMSVMHAPLSFFGVASRSLFSLVANDFGITSVECILLELDSTIVCSARFGNGTNKCGAAGVDMEGQFIC